MDAAASKSFKSYSKLDEQTEEAFRQRSRKRFIIIAVSSVVLLVIIVGALVGTLAPMNNKSKDGNLPSPTESNIRAMCNVTRYPDSCYSSMSSALRSSSNVTDPHNPEPHELFLLSLKVALNEVISLSSLPQRIISSQMYSNETNDPLVQSALHACEILFADAIDYIEESISSIQVGQEDKGMLVTSKIDDVRTWLSTAITDQETCIDGFKDTGKRLILTDEVRYAMTNSTRFTSNSLAIASNLLTILDNLYLPIHRKLLRVPDEHGHVDDGFPTWVHIRDRRLLLEEKPKPNLTVAWDGSGDFKSISEAVESIPKRSKSRIVIYVKEGLYLGNVTVSKDYWNVMIYGDGMNKTIVSASQNVVDGVSTFLSGTCIAAGRGFIAKDMGFQNTAGPQKEQAVALRSSSDQSIFYRCSFDAFQDTLYTHSNRQFYRDCQISGTVDFIFGNAAVVFQNCSIQPRQPMPRQFNTITAQSKSDPNQNTGMSIQGCRMNPFDNLTAPTYLGRPWKDYATTVIMQSYIGGFLDPAGWASWEANVSTVFYAEFQNFGPGSLTDRRVGWPGVRPNITSEEAEKFTVEVFLHGSQWLPQAHIIFDGTL
ncbi:hypothetical protein P3X46_007499 [Hevea brasiliensis]|uniref:Pectinesterase n=1 Tax=Hevea brasiliensis TaxID=3981 RepID=A0ABQ9MTU4_HEVBR|nr:pectinesterase 3 [Hevea brasiliensis]KAJ9183676.1 hypothetical protein P3X46_007499 [Hevea brasiliensis]